LEDEAMTYKNLAELIQKMDEKQQNQPVIVAVDEGYGYFPKPAKSLQSNDQLIPDIIDSTILIVT
jgi:hypothetical protein